MSKKIKFNLYNFPNFKDEDLKRRSYILNIILIFFLILSLYAFFSWIYNYFILKNHNGPFWVNFIPLLIFVVLPLVLLKLSSKGKAKIASLILISLLFLTVLRTTITNGVNLPSAVVAYSLIIFMSGILISPKAPIIFTLIIAGAMIEIYFLQNNGILKVDNNWKKIPVIIIDVIVLNFIYFVIAVTSWLSSKEITKSLIRANKSETKALLMAKRLKIQNENLEKIVDNRTKSLRENQLLQLTEMSSLAEFGKLSAGILHDIKNPLTVMSMNLDSMQENLKKTSAVKEINLKSLIKKSILASKTAESIVKMSQYQLGHEDIKESFEVNKEIKNTIILLKSKTSKLGINIQFESKEKVRILGYSTKLSRVVANLVMNSIDSFEKSKKASARIIVILEKKDKFVYIRVIDNGIGIKKENKNKIFKPFFSTKKSKSKMGFGLYISREIIKNYFKGDIEFKSTYKKGSEFMIKFPINVIS